MTLELRCGDVVPGCEGIVHGTSRDEVMSEAAAHAATAHGMTTVDAATERALAGAIRQV